MSLLCQACGQHPFPILRTWQEQIDQRLKTFHNVYTTELYSFQIIADNISLHIENLKKEQEAAITVLKSTLKLVSPISKVSDDILICIFQHLLTPHFNHGKLIDTSRVHRLTLVCKRWRSILLSIPRFWTRIAVPFIREVLPSAASIRRFLGPLPTRSGALPLSLDARSLPIPMLLGGLEPAALNRITSLHIESGPDQTAEAFESCSLLPNLTQLSCRKVESWGHRADHTDRPFVVNLLNSVAPLVTSFTLELNCRLFEINLPWAQLTVLKLCLRYSVIFNPFPIITQLEKIERLKLELDCANPLTPGALNTTLPNLRMLALVHWDEDDYFPFQLIHEPNLPSLKELRFTLHIWNGYKRLASTLKATPSRWSAITRLQFRLNLDFDTSDAETEKLLGSLWVFKCLEEFCCKFEKESLVTTRIFRLLSRNHPFKGWLFPKLQVLDFTGVDFDEYVLAALRRLLQRRGGHINLQDGTRNVLNEVILSDIPNGYQRCYDSAARVTRSFCHQGVTSVTIIATSELVKTFPEEPLQIGDDGDDDNSGSESDDNNSDDNSTDDSSNDDDDDYGYIS